MAESFKGVLEEFHEYFRDDLIGYIRNPRKRKNYRAAIAGGYGLKKLLESKLNLYGKIRTGDCDITITSFRSKDALYDTYQYFIEKVIKFIHKQKHPEYFNVTLVDQANQYVAALNYHRFAVIMIKYKGYDFVDIAFTDMKLTLKQIDKENSMKVGLPLKTLETYLVELLSLIYFENVSDVYPALYYKRNPIVGASYEKGIKDIQRAQLVCSLTKSNKYIDYCEMMNRIDIDKMQQMTQEERDKYFKTLSSLVKYHKKMVRVTTASVN
jgi:hypothetical protein